MDTPSTLIRERILVEACALFVQHGYDGISMREIAEACSISKAGIYYHFKDKEDLFLALMTDNLERVAKLVIDARMKGRGTRGQIEYFAYELFNQLSSQQRAVIRLANQEMGKLSAEARDLFGKEYFAKFIEPIEEILAEGMRAGELRSIDPLRSTWVLLGMLYPLFSHRAENRPEAGLDVAKLALSIYFDGLSTL
jgi:AcrR family transcriptional regulator